MLLNPYKLQVKVTAYLKSAQRPIITFCAYHTSPFYRLRSAARQVTQSLCPARTKTAASATAARTMAASTNRLEPEETGAIGMGVEVGAGGKGLGVPLGKGVLLGSPVAVGVAGSGVKVGASPIISFSPG